MLEHDIRIGFQIAHVNFVAKLLDVGVFLAQQPAHVREEEATSGVVWVTVCITELVMHSDSEIYRLE